MIEKSAGYYPHFLKGGGEMGELTREFDWSSTPVGNPLTWPQSLRTTVAMLLASKHPMFLWWGKDLIQFYNDAYRPSLGDEGKHPMALGQRGEECWPEIWSIIHPLIQQVLTTGVATWSEDQLIPIYRNGRLEDVYWTFGYSPIYGEEDIIEGVLVVCNETTGKVNILKQLEQSNIRFRELVMNAPVAIAVFRTEKLITEIANEAYLPLVGKTAEEFIGKPLFDSLPETRSAIEPIIKEVLRTKKGIRVAEFPIIINRFGRTDECYFNFVYEPLFDGNEPDGFMVVAHEVSDQVQTRVALEKSEQQIRSLIESAPFPIGVYIGREMRIAFANKTIMDIWGKGEDVIGKRYPEILPELENQHVYEQLDQVYTTGVAFHATNQEIILLVNNTTRKYYFNYSFTPLFDANGSVYGVMNTAADVTDLNVVKQQIQKSEQNLRNTILQAPVAMCILKGSDFVVEIANKRMFELWGKSVADMLNKPLFEGLFEARDQGFERILKNVFETGIAFSASDTPVRLPRGNFVEQVYVNYVFEPYRERDGSISGILAVAIEVTAQVIARHRIEEVVAERTRELANANSNLQRSNAELAQFAYIASHDLQEPLRKISLYSEMLQNHLVSPDERSQGFLQKINAASARMNRLIRDVLSYSELAKHTNVYEKVNLDEIATFIRNDYELLIEQKQAIVEQHNLPEIEAIPLQMSQLFSNLLSNALKYSRDDVPPHITITGSLVEPDEMNAYSFMNKDCRYFRILFKDNGIGFRQEHAVQIFHIFQRLHRKSEYEGTGIGLAMCKKIALNHHGELLAYGSPGEGSEFHLLLPETQLVMGRTITPTLASVVH